MQEFFQEQLGKHSKTIAVIEQNLTAQDNILRALTDTNAKYARIRKENTEVSNKWVPVMSRLFCYGWPKYEWIV